MLNTKARELLLDMKEDPKKYLRISLHCGKGMIALLDGNKMHLKKALIAEFHGTQPVYTYQFDVDNHEDEGFYFLLGVRKNKKLAYITGHGDDVERSGYVQCLTKEDDAEDEEERDAQEEQNVSERFFCGVFTAEHFTFILACSGKHHKMYYRELVRMNDQPDLLDMIAQMSTCMSTKQLEGDHV